jgi:hypothetical protein
MEQKLVVLAEANAPGKRNGIPTLRGLTAIR